MLRSKVYIGSEAPSGVAAAAAVGADGSALPGRGIQPLASLRAHPRTAIFAAVCTLLLGMPLAWIKGAPRYETEALLQVAPRYMRNLREDQELDFQSNSQYRQFVEHQRQSLLRYDILEQALARMGPARTLWVKGGESERRGVERLRNQLQIGAVADTYLLRLSLGAERPDGLAETINAVIAAAIERIKSEEIFGADDRNRNLRNRETELLRTIREKVTERSAIARDLSLTSFAEGTSNPYDVLVSGLRTRLSDARQRRTEAEGAMMAFRSRGDTTLASRSVQEAILNDPGLNGLKSSLNGRRALLLTQRSGLKSEHPGAVAIDRELAEIELELQGQSRRLDLGVRDNTLARLQGTVEQAREVERALQLELAGLEAQATRFAGLYQDAMSLTADLSQMRDELNEVRQRLNFIHVESTSAGFLRLVTPALKPDQAFGPGRKKLALAVLLTALVGGLAAPIVRDLLDRRIRTVNDAQRLMGFAAAGWQIEYRTTATTLFAEQQRRRLAAALLRARRRQARSHIFGFSACKPRAGTTSLVLELATTLSALGYSVLTVEANTQAPDARYRGARAGLLEFLRGQATAAEILLNAPFGGHRIAIGADSARTSGDTLGDGAQTDRIGIEALETLTRALDQWSKTFDFVLVDLPPLLTSADAELLAGIVGQLLLVVEAGGVTRGELTRTRRLLESIDPDALGLVVNRITPFDGGGYLHELMLESITARSLREVFTVPRWSLALAALRLRLQNPTSTRSAQMKPHLLNVFDRICILNLPHRKDRRGAVTRELRSQGIAIDGERVQLIAATLPAGPADFPSTGARGCFLSHLGCLQQALADGIERLLVLEDDVMFLPKIRQTQDLAKDLVAADWDLVYPGHGLAALPGPLRWVRSELGLVGAHCYGVHADALPLLITHLEACLERPSGHPLGSPMHFDGALTVLRRARPDLITLVASQSLAGQRSSRSDIEGPSWLDRVPIPGGAGLARQLRNSWRRLTQSIAP